MDGHKGLLIDYLDELPFCFHGSFQIDQIDQMFLSSLELVHSQRSLSTEYLYADASKMRVKVSITISSALSLDVSIVEVR